MHPSWRQCQVVAVLVGSGPLLAGCNEIACLLPNAAENEQCRVKTGMCGGQPLKAGEEFVIDVTEAGSGDAVAGSVASIEKGCFYCNGHNEYTWGGMAGADGKIRVRIDYAGTLGIHAFQDGFLYGRAICDTTQFSSANVTLKRNRGDIPPKLEGAVANPNVIKAGGSFDLRVNLIGSPDAVNSDETLWVEPRTQRSGRIKPTQGDPDHPEGDSFPDGIYAVTVPAPAAPGEYDYFLQATSHSCVTSDRLLVRVTVTP